MEKSGEYTWRTVKDGRVRSSHAIREGMTFKWTDPPDDGHPGEAFNCRCWAEQVVASAPSQGLRQRLISPARDNPDMWDDIDFSNHFYTESGREVSLSEIGYFTEVIEVTQNVVYPRLEAQVADLMRQNGPGRISYRTENAYTEFGEIIFSFGGGTIRTITEGIVTEKNGILAFEGTVEYQYYDVFTDPLSIRELLRRSNEISHSPAAIVLEMLLNTKTGTLLSDFGGTAYPITGAWKTKLMGTINAQKG